MSAWFKAVPYFQDVYFFPTTNKDATKINSV